jgi:hypothetical protein
MDRIKQRFGLPMTVFEIDAEGHVVPSSTQGAG